MSFTTRAGVRIHFELDGQGEALVLQHGFSDSLESWGEAGWIDRLARRYRVLRIDARGHGRSDKPRDPEAYAAHELAADVLAVLDATGIERASFLGYSLGGRTGFELAGLAPQRFTCFVLGGAHPYAMSMAPLRHALAEGLEGWLSLVAGAADALSSAARAKGARNDLEALRACVARDRPDRAALLQWLAAPTLLYAGARDPLLPEVARCARALACAQLHVVPDATHLLLGLHSGRVLDAVETFLASNAAPARTPQKPKA